MSVLIVDADGEDQSRLARMLAVRGHRVIGAPTLDAARVLLSSCPVDLLLLSEDMLGVTAPELVANLQGECPDCLAVVMTGAEEASSGVRPARFETLRYCEKPFAEGTRSGFETLLEELRQTRDSAV